jgi:dGTPase
MNDKIWNEIISNNFERENKTLSEFACKSEDAIRLFDEKLPDEDNLRPSFFHDTDRIIHSLSYSRYIDKTQVFFLFDNDHITHRVLHVQLVSKIARTIGRFLKLNEDLIESIALAHDIGHTPFGHDGEKYLNNILNSLRQNYYFCHNAQSVRFLKDIENRGKGLNLALQVYDGILCHNGEIVNHKYEPKREKVFECFLD